LGLSKRVAPVRRLQASLSTPSGLTVSRVS